VIFVDSNVWMYAVGRPHPHRQSARDFLRQVAAGEAPPAVLSAEVLQELVHVYLATRRPQVLDDALSLIAASGAQVWPVEPTDVLLARELARTWPSLTARDLLHLACCQRRGVRQIKTWDRALEAAFTATPRRGPAP